VALTYEILFPSFPAPGPDHNTKAAGFQPGNVITVMAGGNVVAAPGTGPNAADQVNLMLVAVGWRVLARGPFSLATALTVTDMPSNPIRLTTTISGRLIIISGTSKIRWD
jgi:hypothetical protein